MWNQFSGIMQRSADRMAENIANFLPGLLLLIVILAATVVAALIVRALVERLLRSLDFDRRMAEQSVPGLGGSPSTLVGRLTQWTIIVIGALIGATALDAALPQRFALTVFEYLPNVLAALVILVVGLIVSRFLARSVLISAVNLQMHSARLISLGVQWLVLVLAGAMALEHLGIGRQILLLAFAILFGGIVLAMALAIGLGSKEMVGRSWEQMLERQKKEEEDRIDHV